MVVDDNRGRSRGPFDDHNSLYDRPVADLGGANVPPFGAGLSTKSY